MDLTFQSFLTPEGVVAAAAVITVLIQLLKGVFPAIDARVSGALMAFVLSAVLYVLTALAVGVADANAGLAVFLAWLSCATSSVGIKSTADHVQSAGPTVTTLLLRAISTVSLRL
jgi:hypothetical protein